jgi:hypothetical protein
MYNELFYFDLKSSLFFSQKIINMKKHVTLLIAALCCFSQIGFSQVNCPEPSAHANINANNINAKISNGGYLFRGNDVGNGDNYGAFQVPYANSESPATIFAAGLWLGGYTGLPNNPILKMSSVDYGSGSDGYFPGPLTDVGTIGVDTCTNWNKIWTVTKAEIEAHILDIEDNGVIDNPISSILGFPCKGNDNFFDVNGFDLPDESTSSQGFALFVDNVDPSGLIPNEIDVYEPHLGDFPTPIRGGVDGPVIPSQMSWCVFNDLRSTSPGRLEIQLTTWAVEDSNTPVLDNTIFTSYRIINRGQDPIDSFHVGVWLDFDLGCPTDDFIGSDPCLNTFYAYNQDLVDGGANGDCPAGISTYGIEPPVQAVTFLGTKMDHFMAYNNAAINNPPLATTSPTTPTEYFNYLSGSWKDGTPLTEGGSGYNPMSSDSADHAFPGNPNNLTEWSMESTLSSGGDVRAIASTSQDDLGFPDLIDMSLSPQEILETTIAWSFHQGNGYDRLENVDLMLAEVEQLGDWYEDRLGYVPRCEEISSNNNIDFGKNISLFPNPNNGTFELDFPHGEISQVQVFDVSGKLIWEKIEAVENSVTIYLQNIANGIYFLKGKTAEGVFYKKIVVGE